MELLTPERIRRVQDVKLTLETFTGDLRAYQKLGAVYLCQRSGVILADPCGTGKTWEALAALALLFERCVARSALVVTLGTSVEQWADEIEAHTDWGYQIYRGSRRKHYLNGKLPDVRLTTYETMRSDVNLLAGQGHNVVIYDEATCLQNAWPAPKGPSQVHMAARQLSQSAQWVWAMTATPVETSLMNMYAIYKAMGRSLYASTEEFIAAHIEMEMVEIPVITRVSGQRRFQQRITVPKVKRNIGVPQFKQRVADLYLRRELDEIGLELPEVYPVDVLLEMQSAQRRVYDEITEGILATGPSVFRTVAGGVKLNYQARCCDGLGSLKDPTATASVKLDEAVRRIRDDLLPEQVVVFSRFLKPLEELQARLVPLGITAARIDGEVGEQACSRAKRGFESGEVQVLLLSEKGERALNLPQSRYLIALNQIWNPQKMVQLIGRLRRMTSTYKGIFVFNFLCRDTVEEGMMEVVRERSELFTDVFDSADLLKALSPEEAFALVTRRRAH